MIEGRWRGWCFLGRPWEKRPIDTFPMKSSNPAIEQSSNEKESAGRSPNSLGGPAPPVVNPVASWLCPRASLAGPRSVRTVGNWLTDYRLRRLHPCSTHRPVWSQTSSEDLPGFLCQGHDAGSERKPLPERRRPRLHRPAVVPTAANFETAQINNRRWCNVNL